MKTLDEFLDEIEKKKFCFSNSQCSEEKDKLIKINRELQAFINLKNSSTVWVSYSAHLKRIDKILNEGDGE